VKRNTSDQERVNDRAAVVEKRLRAQYTALDAKMGSLTALNSYIAQQVTQWNKTSG
jgi:flagellar hook-associated protein 2